METMEIRLKDVLKEEQINVDELPSELRKRINTLNSAISRYETKPTEGLAKSIAQEDALLCNDIYDYMDELESKSEAKVKADEEAKAKADEEAKAKAQNQQNEKKFHFGTQDMVKAIQEKMKDNCISVNELASIIGKKPDYPTQDVYNIKLRKKFMSEVYIFCS